MKRAPDCGALFYVFEKSVFFVLVFLEISVF